ncbi:hypothetical protein [Sinomicrobium soli]|uniref:hypothetical protein n=1 Tax=Sinomicrobium sp. N-1-3-6 TaxID=2219864 RepID=UPI000DCD49DE|nr:hypothetical protein [Sinomicrobium sp. N-1-3-6]RAV29432.1 hypothetical protein DN748_07975 [Sinomicrobium sp. N-1-3-6]
MKKIFFILLFLSGVFLVQCGRSGYVLSSPPEGVADMETVAEHYTAGRGEGIRVFVPAGVPDTDTGISLDSIYYRGRRAALRKTEKDSYAVYIADFPATARPDRVVHSDPRKESGNRPSSVSSGIPFDLEDNEAVVRYTEKGKVRYFRISRVRLVEPGSH